MSRLVWSLFLLVAVLAVLQRAEGKDKKVSQDDAKKNKRDKSGISPFCLCRPESLCAENSCLSLFRYRLLLIECKTIGCPLHNGEEEEGDAVSKER